MKKSESRPTLTFKSSQELQTYLSGQPQTAKGFWLKLSKAGAPEATITKDEAIETALCCGWIDGQLAKLDDSYFLVRMTPRRPGSRWSAKNRAAADRLAGRGRLLPTGLAEIDAAKADGRWDAAYPSQGKAEPPQDLLAALRSNKAALHFFDGLDRANRYAIIYRVGEAKRPETRATRIAKFIEMLARGETIHPPRRRHDRRYNNFSQIRFWKAFTSPQLSLGTHNQTGSRCEGRRYEDELEFADVVDHLF